MDDKQFLQLTRKLDAIHTSLAAIGRALRSEAPNYQRPLSAYATFDWSSIDAVVQERDGSGPTRVEYLGHMFTRRNGTGKFGEAIWFSRPQGKNEDGSNRYARLVTFKDYGDAEELDDRLENAVWVAPPPPQTAPVPEVTPPTKTAPPTRVTPPTKTKTPPTKTKTGSGNQGKLTPGTAVVIEGKETTVTGNFLAFQPDGRLRVMTNLGDFDVSPDRVTRLSDWERMNAEIDAAREEASE